MKDGDTEISEEGDKKEKEKCRVVTNSYMHKMQVGKQGRREEMRVRLRELKGGGRVQAGRK